MSRLPIRRQVTLAFAASLAIVLIAVGAFVYLRVAAELQRTVDSGLRSRAAEVTALRASATALAGARAVDDESFAAVLSRGGAVLDATPGAPGVRLTAPELSRAGSRPTFLERADGAADGEPARLLAQPAGSGDEIVLVGSAIDDQREALAALLTFGGLGLAAALLLASAAGWWVAGLALRPVEAMRAAGEAITDTPDRRLPVPPVDDELGRLGATLNAMLARLEHARTIEQEAAAKERRFVADASHELRTPLAILKSEIDVALAVERPTAELRAALVSIGEEADRLIRLAEDLLVLARADEGRLPITREPVALRELLGGIVARAQPTSPARSRLRRQAPASTSSVRDGEIAVDVPPGLTVPADPRRLRQAVTNLLDNALLHGGGRIEVSAFDGDGEVRIAVRDHGPGFPDGFAERAFERFARPDAGRSGGGAGLGLAIVDAIARAHGGTAVATAADPGTRVTIVLPSGSSFHHQPPPG